MPRASAPHFSPIGQQARAELPLAFMRQKASASANWLFSILLARKCFTISLREDDCAMSQHGGFIQPFYSTHLANTPAMILLPLMRTHTGYQARRLESLL